MTPIVLDVNNMLAPALGDDGLDPSLLEGELADRFRDAHMDVSRRREEGEMGFFQLPYAQESLAQVQELADGFGQWFENLVVLGIGGSSLGTRVLRDALLGPLWNQGSDEERDYYPRLYLLDNVDPASMADLLERIDLRRTLFNVVSKSGSTAETMAQFLVVGQRLEEVVGSDQARGHFLFTTDPERGALRELSRSLGVPTLAVPPDVGGRFSVLSPVGLLPAAVTGIDVAGLLRGAARMDERCRTPELTTNPAGLLAVLLHWADTRAGAPIHVLMPYSDRLRSLALWFQQLWAESLGKALNRAGEEVHVGPTPLPAVGATDQHSQVQLFMEGPGDKVVIFIGVDEAGAEVEIPGRYPEIPQLSYLGGSGLGHLLATERRATTEALRRRGRPSMTLEVDTISAETLGGLLFLFQVATVYAGALYGVNPLDQPGVELGKNLTYGLMGREGYDAPSFPEVDERWRI